MSAKEKEQEWHFKYTLDRINDSVGRIKALEYDTGLTQSNVDNIVGISDSLSPEDSLTLLHCLSEIVNQLDRRYSDMVTMCNLMSNRKLISVETHVKICEEAYRISNSKSLYLRLCDLLPEEHRPY